MSRAFLLVKGEVEGCPGADGAPRPTPAPVAFHDQLYDGQADAVPGNSLPRAVAGTG